MSTETKISILDQFRDARRRFEQVQRQWSSYGALDTEPNAVFAAIMRRAISGDEVRIPTTGDGWELYASTMDCAEAAAALHEACQAVVDIIRACPLGESRELRDHIRGWYDW